MRGELEGQVLAHLHANSALTPAQIAATVGAPAADVERAVEALLASGHLERQGDRLVPDADSHPTPGLFVATERPDAEPVEVDYGDE